MNYSEFLNRVIETGIEGARHDYNDPLNSTHALMLKGAIEGFDLCREKSPEQLNSCLLSTGQQCAQAFQADADDYWLHATRNREVEWVCNCVSCLLINEGLSPIIQPTAQAMLHTNHILADAA